MKLRISCTTEHAVDAARSIETWLEQVDAGELDGDQIVSDLNTAIDLLVEQKNAVLRALGS